MVVKRRRWREHSIIWA